MKTIIITLQVPDGVNVEVNQGGSNGRPFVAQPPPPEPSGFCPVHDAPWRLVPAGTSRKSGKPYNSFWACSVRDCLERPGREERDEVDWPAGY